MHKFQLSLLLVFVVLIQGCSTTNRINTQTLQSPYLDQYFPYEGVIETEQDMFNLTPDMRRYVQKRLSSPQMSTRKKAETLIRDLFSPEYMNIAYRHDANFYPAETFDKGLANCMSLTVLAYVLAEHAGLDTEFMSVEVEENWNVLAQTTLLNGHVNLEISTPESNSQVFYTHQRSFVIDFLPMLNVKPKSKTPLSKDQIAALFYNNKGAEALTENKPNLAYQHFKRASLLAPKMSSIWGNLASLYRQSGHIEQAENLYLHATQLDPNNLNIQENMALLYRLTGRERQAKTIEDKVYNARKNNPYFFAMKAEEALYKNDPSNALALFKQAIKLNRKEHSFYFGMAKSALLLNQFEQAEKYLLKASNLSKDNRQKLRYQNKMTALSNLVAKAY